MKLFIKNSPSGNVVHSWWNELNTGNKANLRRCNSPSETIYLPISHILISKLHDCEDISFKLSSDKVCAIAGILSHVKEDNSISFAKQLSQKKSGSEQALVSDIRFRRILQYSNIAEDELFYQKIIRVIHHVDRRINISDIFYSLYFWGNKVKKQWAYDYYGTANQSENETEDQTIIVAQGANNE